MFTSTTAKLKVPKGDENFSIIQGTGALRSAVEKRLRLRNEIFTTEQLQTIIESLEKTTDPPDKKKKAHIKQARKSQRRRLAIKEKRRKARKKKRRKKTRTSMAKRTILLLALLESHYWISM
ncbi:MAG: hypothetical protein IJO87_04165 [Eggerthellaceae bacterium]|nr:hypothetical protein [Eggerthellaceae bacterium]